MIEPQSGHVSLEDYLRIDAVSPDRLEYRGGQIYAQAVPCGNHEEIKNNLIALLAPIIKKSGCKLFSGGVKVICPNGDRTIPDLGVTCDQRDRIALESGGEAIIEHPWLVVEILSSSTQAEDRIEKLDSYRAIPELTHYLLIDSRRRWMLVHERESDGLFAINGPLESVTLPTLVPVTLDLVYDGTTVSLIS
jgi:Uma2 family endonuclease